VADREGLRGINPNGHIPVLEDDGLIIWESMAINLYLGDKLAARSGRATPSSARSTIKAAFGARRKLTVAIGKRSAEAAMMS